MKTLLFRSFLFFSDFLSFISLFYLLLFSFLSVRKKRNKTASNCLLFRIGPFFHYYKLFNDLLKMFEDESYLTQKRKLFKIITIIGFYENI